MVANVCVVTTEWSHHKTLVAMVVTKAAAARFVSVLVVKPVAVTTVTTTISTTVTEEILPTMVT